MKDSHFTIGKAREAKETLERYNRFMALKGKKRKIVDAIDHLNLTPGVSWRGWHGAFSRIPMSSKGDLAEAYATGRNFEPGSLAKLEKELGTTWPANKKGGLW